MAYKPLPIGVDDFEVLRTKGYYYVDKTLLIKELLDKKGEVTLFTRPRRFGKTLNMSMLRYYFELAEESRQPLFTDLKILKQGDEYTAHMGAYPVVMITLKSAKQKDFSASYQKITEEIGREFRRHKILLQSDALDSVQKEKFSGIMEGKASVPDYTGSLKFLSEVLMEHYGKKAIVLIDEYDVPLEHAYFSGFYDEMAVFIHSLFEEALKSNPFLEFSVITGCLRISKESIFTGLNNLKVNTILSANYDEYFGFLQTEVDAMAAFYGMADEKSMALLKEWYDGYTFGTKEVYNPWSIINHIDTALADRKHAWPAPYWANTSSNNIVKSLIERADLSTKEELEQLIAGGLIEKQVHEDITYEDIEKSEDNLWNFLFFTGYLKLCGRRPAGEAMYITMAIPNLEIRYIYKNKIMDWFREQLMGKSLEELYGSIVSEDAVGFQSELTRLLRESISFYDNKEAFYHGFLLGLLERMDGYAVWSNRESGDGRYDIILKSPDVEKPLLVFELKAPDTYQGLEKAAEAAVLQIRDRRYGEEFLRDGYTEKICYGIAFYKKNCRIKVEHVDIM